jgi:hypothetical protein
MLITVLNTFVLPNYYADAAIEVIQSEFGAVGMFPLVRKKVA